MFDFTIKKLGKGLYLTTFKNQYELASTFMRLEEFYESPIEECRGKYFDLETYMDRYSKISEKKNFTYCVDWNGFNVPGDVVKKFLKLYNNKLLQKEKHFFDRLKKEIDWNDDFYIIGVHSADERKGGSTKDHEIAHGMYYLLPEYKKVMDAISRTLPKKIKDSIFSEFKHMGYDSHVFKDELQAYLSTSTMCYITEMCKTDKLPWDKIYKMQKQFESSKNIFMRSLT